MSIKRQEKNLFGVCYHIFAWIFVQRLQQKLYNFVDNFHKCGCFESCDN